MNKEEIKLFCLNNKDNFAIQLKRHHKNIYDEINNLYTFENFAEKLYVYILGESLIGKCKVCNKKTKFDGYWKGYREYCSYKCKGEDKSNNANETRKCIICDKEFIIYKIREKTTCSSECLLKLNSSDKVNEKRMISLKSTMIKKYGVDHPSKMFGFKEKVKNTKLKNHGNENYNNIEKSKKTKLEKYDDKNYVNVNKIRKTCLEKYGVDNFSKTDMFKKIHFNKNISKFTNIEPLFNVNSYFGIDKHYDFKCKICDTIFNSYIDNGHIPICRSCFPIDRELEQKNILLYIKTLIPNETIITSDRSIIRPQELDIYIPSLKIAIEYNGIYWHGEISNGKNKNYHLNKTIKCNDKGINLIHIFENEWLYKTDIVKRRLNHILNNVKKDSIYARKCNVEKITFFDSNEFLKKYHLQGEDKSSIQLGMFYENELVSVMTFGSNRIALGNKNIKDEYEIIRFCIGNKNVVGGGSKLLSYFIKKYNPSKITTYADRRWSKGNIYKKLNFSLNSYTTPNYWYFKLKDTTKLYHRFNFRKSELHKKLQIFDPSLTEWENMQLNGFDRIWDCGHLKFVWENTDKNFKHKTIV